MNDTQCSADGCDSDSHARGLCSSHYMRFRRSGKLNLLPMPTPAERLAAGLVRMPNGCLEWTGADLGNGYGYLGVEGKNMLTHRFAWELANGPIPDGLCVLHHCDNPPCAETEPSEAYPEGHLFLGTQADNASDMTSKGRQNNQLKTHCPQKHLYSGKNLYVDTRGRRRCRTCLSVQGARSYARKKAKDGHEGGTRVSVQG